MESCNLLGQDPIIGGKKTNAERETTERPTTGRTVDAEERGGGNVKRGQEFTNRMKGGVTHEAETVKQKALKLTGRIPTTQKQGGKRCKKGGEGISLKAEQKKVKKANGGEGIWSLGFGEERLRVLGGGGRGGG